MYTGSTVEELTGLPDKDVTLNNTTKLGSKSRAIFKGKRHIKAQNHMKCPRKVTSFRERFEWQEMSWKGWDYYIEKKKINCIKNFSPLELLGLELMELPLSNPTLASSCCLLAWPFPRKSFEAGEVQYVTLLSPSFIEKLEA